MSIYRRPGWIYGDSVQQFPLGGKANARAGSPSSEPSAGAQDWTRHRKAQPAEHLLPAGKRWLQLLPPEVFPSALAAHYPRIVNLIAMQWNDLRACPAYFDGLLVDRRGGRQGFPDAVTGELLKLLDYWYDENSASKR